MAFNNVSVFKLKNSLNSIDVNPNKLNNLLEDMDEKKWVSNGKTKIKEALSAIKDNYVKLEKIKSDGKRIAELIDEYKTVEKNLNYTKNKLASLNYSTNENKDTDLIQRYENDANYYRKRLSDLESSINNYL